MIKQVILFRKDLNMRKGKIAAQVAHASMKVFFDRAPKDHLAVLTQHVSPEASGDDFYVDYGRSAIAIPLTPDMREWVFGIFAKIVCSVATEADLLLAYRLAQEADLPCALIQDLGATEFHGVPTYTTMAIGPARAELIDPITGKDVGAVKTTLA